VRSSAIDRELVLRARAGDLQAFSTLVDARLDRLYAVARLIVQHDPAAEEAVRGALLRAWQDLRSLRDPDRFDPWLYRLLIRACDRAASRRERRPTGEVELDTGRDEIQRGFGDLAPAHRAAIVVRHVLGLSLAESAEMLGVPIGVVQSRVSRATTSLRASQGADVSTTAEPEPPS
jgi:RNA polymerase sigma-70 factor, ECF subfamily